jgi:hypothetical protein
VRSASGETSRPRTRELDGELACPELTEESLRLIPEGLAPGYIGRCNLVLGHETHFDTFRTRVQSLFTFEFCSEGHRHLSDLGHVDHGMKRQRSWRDDNAGLLECLACGAFLQRFTDLEKTTGNRPLGSCGLVCTLAQQELAPEVHETADDDLRVLIMNAAARTADEAPAGIARYLS